MAMEIEKRPNLEALGSLVRERRTALGLTQTELGARLGWAQERVSVLEHGKYGLPAIPQLNRLAEALDVHLAELLHATGMVIDDAWMQIERRRPHKPGQVDNLQKTVISIVDRMHVVESRLVDAELQLQKANALRDSIRQRREEMATLLEACRAY